MRWRRSMILPEFRALSDKMKEKARKMGSNHTLSIWLYQGYPDKLQFAVILFNTTIARQTFAGPVHFFHASFAYASAAPRASQAAIPSLSGSRLQITKSHAKFAPASLHLCSQILIHSPSPQS